MEHKNAALIKALETTPSDELQEDFLDVSEAPKKQIAEGMCVECEDTPAVLRCEQCQDIYCDLCFKSQHRKGRRVNHKHIQIINHLTRPEQKPESKQMEEDLMTDEQPITLAKEPTESLGDWFAERCKYIPIRLTLKERKMLRLLEAALSVSEYTDKIDIMSYKNKGQRIHAQLQEICAILLGLVVAVDYKIGQAMIADKAFKDNAKWFQGIFELGRRHKIMNPEKMRSEYGKLIYLLQDSVNPDIQNLMEFSMIKPIKTVYAVFLQHNVLKIFQDPNMMTATSEIIDDGKKTRQQIQREIKQKEAAIDYISRKYATDDFDEEEIKQCIYSISDNNSFLAFNRDPVDKMIQYLTSYFSPTSFETDYSLAIYMGQEGARLSHNHERQYAYVLQSLTLWREILHDMFKLWYLAEQDLLDEENSYRLRDTGQGLNRVQSAPKIGKAISKILHQTQHKVGNWVGSSVIHLGDHNVPNSLMFIDKYTQVSRILNPIVRTIDQVPILAKDAGVRKYIETSFKGCENLRKEILSDFFRHAFDGSGADNFFDAGSCIDGRLTSAWNWCSKIEKKSYYPIFKLAGFSGFDGDFQK